MSNYLDIINLQALQNSPLNEEPYPYLIIDNILKEESLHQLIKDLPKTNMAGSIPLQSLEPKGTFAQLIKELNSELLKQAIMEKFQIDLTDCPNFITYRSRVRQKDGRIHTDTKTKIMTVLLYLNPNWEAPEGRLRILKNGKNLEDYVDEIIPIIGRCLIFKVTDNCWHGHKPLVSERRAIQLNYLRDEKALSSHLNKHSFSAKFKNWFGSK